MSSLAFGKCFEGVRLGDINKIMTVEERRGETQRLSSGSTNVIFYNLKKIREKQQRRIRINS